MTEPVAHWIEAVGTHGSRIVIILIIAILAVRLLRATTARLVESAKTQTRVAQAREQQTRTMAGVLYSLGFGIVVIVALLAALPELGFNVTPVAAAAGLASLAIGFGGQYLVKDLINGFFIIFEDQYGVGDVIRANSEVGRVEIVTLRRTVLRNDRGAVISIPNGLIGLIANLSRDWSQTYVDVTVPSGEAVGRALALLEKVCGEFRSDADWAAALIDGPRVLGIESLNLDGTALRIQLRSAALRADDVARELRRRVKSAFEQAHILVANTQPVELIGRATGAS
ncbi:MAG: mechanosensitive ion channel family protein [Candidatus Acidiferrales bacterium]|jgi:small-conductance mechanosensitive channel